MTTSIVPTSTSRPSSATVVGTPDDDASDLGQQRRIAPRDEQHLAVEQRIGDGDERARPVGLRGAFAAARIADRSSSVSCRSPIDV